MLLNFVSRLRHIKSSSCVSRPNNIGYLFTPSWMPVVFTKMNLAECSKQNKHRVVYKDYVPPCPEDHDHRNMRLNRPMSPHLDIYAPTLPAMTSILQRINGVVLVAYYLLLSGGTLFLANGIETYCTWIKNLNIPGPVAIGLKFLIGVLFWHHYFNGLRFCAWNFCKLMDMKSVYSTGYGAAIAAVAVSAALAVLT